MTSTAPVSHIRACFMALFDAVEASPAGWDDARWEQFVHVLDETGRLVLGYGSSIIWPDTLTEVFADAIGDSVKDLEAAIAALKEPPTGPTVLDAVAAYITDQPRRARVDADLVAASELAELRRLPEPVSGPRPIIPAAIPAAEPEVDAQPVELTDVGEVQEPANNIGAPLRIEAAFVAPARPKPPAVPLGPGTVRCDPGCGGEFYPAGFAAHRRHCAAYRAHVDANARVVEPRPGAVGPAPDGTDVDVLEAREEADATFAERARAKAADTWARRHPGETRPERPERAPYGTKDDDGLTARQREILDALRASDGRIKEAARALGIESHGPISGQISALRSSGRLPADVAALIEARRNERLGTKPAVQP